ncbi:MULTISPECIES: PE-PPE domain-containing protein [unclassified Mycobacterium]|uniref:PE family protein n=1 Tax=unclassified Mycobacterium TaxID=2642494 RepID=UPI002740E0A6|nr:MULTISPECIES: PE-PPE domain-containing protein [unclassified Mycobacterium]MDP7704524.1 PE-PPE domain-containing protein [Mycobacterium sp. TY815]MDP7722992.1 PE-PPE domain-containing protein [Mycobacterium sp. TY814]
MTYLSVEPDLIAAAVADLANVRGAVVAANAGAAAETVGFAAAAADEVSAAIAKFFDTYGRECQLLMGRAAEFHANFARGLTAGGLAYLETEIANAFAGVLYSEISPFRSLLTSMATAPAAAVTLVMGASGYPIPIQDYIQGLPPLYIDPFFPGGPNIGINTPEGLYPLTGVKDLTFDVSAARGLTILNNAINQAFAGLPAGSNVNVFGYSQSSVIASMEMKALNPGNVFGAGPNLNFTLVGNPSNPNGGLLTRFPGLSLPSLGLTLFGTATPDNSFATNIFTREYDGFGDFPQYPLNIVSDINAFLGIIELHGSYPFLSPEQLTVPPAGTAVELTNTVGPVSTHYYMIRTENLPILSPLRAIPVIGHPLASLIEPNMRVIVNLGYGSTTQGWSPDPPNVPTGFGVIPPVSPLEIAQALGAGTQQGISDFAADIRAMIASPPAVPVPDMPTILQSINTGGTTLANGLSSTLSSPDSFIASVQAANNYVTNGISTSASAAVATLLPTADVANAMVTSVPSYNINIMLTGAEMIADGDPLGGSIYALGGPLAANVGLLTLFAGFEVRVFQHALSQIISAWTGAPPPSTAVGAFGTAF